MGDRYFPNTYHPSRILPVEPKEINNQIQHYTHQILHKIKPDVRNTDGGLYVGTPGIAFMLYYMAKNSNETQSPDASVSYLKKATDYLKPALEAFKSGDETSFLLGDAGVLAVTSAVFHELRDYDKAGRYAEQYGSLHSKYLVPSFKRCGGDELFVGRAGYLAGLLWLQRAINCQILPPEKMYAICDAIVDSGREYSKRHRCACPLMYAYYETEYLGAAHGLCFILQMLITVPGYLESNQKNAEDIRTSIDFTLSLQAPDGNWPCAMDELNLPRHKLVHWCHGAPGVVYLMARAYIVYKDPRYLQSCVKAADLTWQRGLLKKGPGICHGVAGNAYVFLLLHRLTEDKSYLLQAHAFADFMQTEQFNNEASVPDNPYSLYEGLAGTVVFLTDLLTPCKAEFPFQNVFTN